MDSIISTITVLKDFRGFKAGEILYKSLSNDKFWINQLCSDAIHIELIINYKEYFRIDFKE